MRNRVGVVLAEDHPVFRAGLRRALEQDAGVEVVGEARDGRQALALIRARNPDLALVDVRMPAVDGIELVRTVVAEELPTRVVVLSAFVDGALVHQALAAGAAGYVSKEEDEAVLLELVARAADGQLVVSEGLQAAALEHVRRPATTGSLSAREAEILQEMARGKSDAQIGEDLDLGVETVRTYKKRLYRKLGVSSGAGAVAEAMRRGLVQ